MPNSLLQAQVQPMQYAPQGFGIELPPMWATQSLGKALPPYDLRKEFNAHMISAMAIMLDNAQWMRQALDANHPMAPVIREVIEAGEQFSGVEGKSVLDFMGKVETSGGELDETRQKTSSCKGSAE